MVERLVLLGLAGALGTLARYGMHGAVHRAVGHTFPWGTVAVNVGGCLLFGIIWTLSVERAVVSTELRVVLLAGFMGAFTTFSTFAFETVQLIRDDRISTAVANVTLQNVAGVLAVALGMSIARVGESP